MLVPSADVAIDGQLRIGISRIPVLYSDQLRPYERTVFFFCLGYLPFLEGTAMVVRPDNYAGGIGDRSVHIKLRLLGEDGRWPALALGAQDFFGIKKLHWEPADAQKFAELYAVASKNLHLNHLAISLHLGYGTDWLPAQSRYLDGFFGGIVITPHRYLSVLAEYDAKKINAGVRLHPCSHLQAQLAYWKLQHWTANLVFSFSLY